MYVIVRGVVSLGDTSIPCIVSLGYLVIVVLAYPVLFVVVLEPLPNTTEATEYLQKNINPVLLRGLTRLCKEKPADALVSEHTLLA